MYKEYVRGDQIYLAYHITNHKETTLFKNHVINMTGGFTFKHIDLFHRFLIREFGNSPYFTKGFISPIQKLNQRLQQERFRLEGVTARACDVKGFSLYDDVKEKTSSWNQRIPIYLDEIHYLSSKHKSLAAKNKDVVCMIEDDATALPNFLEKGIPCILIDVTHDSKHEQLKRELIKKHTNLLYVVNNHEEVERVMFNLIEML